MITGIQDAYVSVQDMARAVRFYRDALDCKIVEESPYWTALDVNGFRFGLHWTGGPAVEVIPANAHGALGGATLTFASNDIAADRERLITAGADILGEMEQPFGRLVVFRDPDGNPLKIMRPAQA